MDEKHVCFVYKYINCYLSTWHSHKSCKITSEMDFPHTREPHKGDIIYVYDTFVSEVIKMPYSGWRQSWICPKWPPQREHILAPSRNWYTVISPHGPKIVLWNDLNNYLSKPPDYELLVFSCGLFWCLMLLLLRLVLCISMCWRLWCNWGYGCTIHH